MHPHVTALQIYMNDTFIQEQFEKTLDETIKKIESGYYDWFVINAIKKWKEIKKNVGDGCQTYV